MSAFEMDARYYGRQEGRSEDMQAGIAQGFSDGARQTKLETVQLVKRFGDSVQKIMQATGLSKEEIENL